jgi:hypothetical protein
MKKGGVHDIPLARCSHVCVLNSSPYSYGPLLFVVL